MSVEIDPVEAARDFYLTMAAGVQYERHIRGGKFIRWPADHLLPPRQCRGSGGLGQAANRVGDGSGPLIEQSGQLPGRRRLVAG